MKKSGSKHRIRTKSAVGSKAACLDSQMPTESDHRQFSVSTTGSDEFGRAMIEHSPLGISVRDANGRLLTVNQAWRDIWQVPPELVDEYLTSENTELRFDEKDEYLGEWLPELEKIYREGGRLTIPEIRLPRHRSGEVRWVSQIFYAICDATGAVDRVVILTRDITARKEAEEALRESRGQYEQLFNSMIDGFALHEIICDDSGRPVDYRFLAINPAFERLTGLKAQNILGKTALETLPDLESIWIERYGAVALTGKPVHFREYSAALEKHYEVTAYRPVERQFACVFVDITEHQQAIEALQKSEEIFRTIVTNAQPIIFMIDRDGLFVLSEGRMLSGLGLKPGQVVGQSAFQLYQDYPAIIQGLRRALEGESSTGIVEAEGKYFDSFWSPYRDPDGEIAGVIGMSVDITERKAAEEALLKKNVALREILNQISADQEAIKEQIATNIHEAVLPTLSRLAETADPEQAHLIDILKQDLEDTASPFLDTLRQRYAKLTPRETELCRLIRGGRSSKEIAEILHLSLGTVHKHREMIRRKLGLTNQDVNLATFLQSI